MGTPKNKLSQLNELVGCVSVGKPNYTKRLFMLTHPTFWIFFYLKVPILEIHEYFAQPTPTDFDIRLSECCEKYGYIKNRY
jgi:hypothetical protein